MYRTLVVFVSRFILAISAITLMACTSNNPVEDDDTVGETENRAPSASIVSNQNVTINNSIELSGSNSSDPDGDSINYSWTFISVPSGSNAQITNNTAESASFVADLVGDYIVRLIVNDGVEDGSPEQITISASNVQSSNDEPIADSGGDQAVTTGASVSLSAANSSDPDGDTLTYLWTFTSVPVGSSAQILNASQVNPSFTADLEGNYVLQLIVNDGVVNSQPDSVTIIASSGGSGGPNATGVTSIDVHATFHNVGIQVDITGDENNNAIATLEANIDGGGFKTVHPLSKVFLVTSPAGNYPQRFVGTVFSVEPETNVEVRVTISDPDGVSDGVQTASITTRSRDIPSSTGAVFHVALSGNDTTGTGSLALPFKTIQHGVDQLAIGDSLLVHAGTYHEHVVINNMQNSLDQAYTTIKSAGDGEVILSGTDSSTLDASAWTSEGGGVYSAPLDSANNDTYYVGFNGNRMWKYFSRSDLNNTIYGAGVGGFYADSGSQKVFARFPNGVAPAGHQMTVSNLKYGFQLGNVNNIVIDGFTLENFSNGEYANAIQLDDETYQTWVVNNKFEHMETGVRLEGMVVDTVVMGNEFSDQGVTQMDWNTAKDHQHWLERGALNCSNDHYIGYGTIFYDNYVHEFFDGIKIVGEDVLTYASNSDVENNRFFNLSDDGIETDGYSSNVRIQNNRFESLLIGVSVAPANAGPTYINHNLMVDLKNVAFTDWATGAVKFSIGDEIYGDIFIYHNTGTTTEANREAFSVSNESDWTKMVMKNNIWSGQSYAIYYYLDNAASLDWVEDNDLLYSSSGLAAQYQGDDYADIPDYFAAAGVCENCLEGSPLFVNQASGDYSLTGASPAVDSAVLIPGINALDTNGNLPDIGALQRVDFQ